MTEWQEKHGGEGGWPGDPQITHFSDSILISIKADNLIILSKNIRPLPNMKEKEGTSFNTFEDKELRYRHRQLDLIANPTVKDIFRKRSKIISSIREYLDKNKLCMCLLRIVERFISISR